MKTKAEVLLKRMTILYENIYNLLSAFALGSTSNSQVNVELKKEDGTSQTVPVNSFQMILQELKRIDNNLKALTTEPSYILNSDGTISSYHKITYLNAEYLENFKFDGNECIVDKNTVIADLIYPTVKLPITIDSDIIKTDIYCKIYEITDGWDKIPDEPKELALEYLSNTGDITYNDYYRTLKLERQFCHYFGKFTIETIITGETDNEFIMTLNSIKYTSKSTIGDNIDLKIGDYLVSSDGNNKYEITDIDKFQKKITVIRRGGMDIPKVGVNVLEYNEVLPTDINVVNVPIKPAQKLVVFLSTENINAISYPSVGIKIDTTDFLVSYNGTSYSLDEYFQKYVTNFQEYLISLMSDTTIPYSLGIKPNTPILNRSNFKVVQINKHLIDAKTESEMLDLNKKKNQIQNEIDYKQVLIDQTQNELDTLKFNSLEERNYRVNKIIELRTEINTLKQNLLAVIRDIDSNATKYGLKTSKPKYKVIGFWDMQEPIFSPLTKAQHIIKYDVEYRYLSKDIDISDVVSYKMVSEGKEVTVAFSNWNELPTKALNKVTDINGDLQWEEPLLDSADNININQCAITINEGESIELKVRAVSEAGYPIAPLKSDWSESLRIDFPDDLKQNNLQATVAQNTIDLNKAEFNAILQNQGLLKHISGTIIEAEKTFHHNAADISSGQYTPEQKNIPLDVCIKNILNDIAVLKQQEVSENIAISLVDFDNESYTITNNTTIELSAGNYNDDYNILDNNAWGSIVTKRAYIKIRNNNNVPIEFKSLIPGDKFESLNAPDYYNVPVVVGDNVIQQSKQIIYFRNKDLIAQGNGNAFKLVVPKAATDNTYPADTYIDNSAEDTKKNLVYLKTDEVKICKLLDNDTHDDFLCFTTEHPDYDYNAKDKIKPELQRLAKFNPNLKAEQYQSEVSSSGDENFVGFTDNDKFAVGRYSCGAWFYPYISKPSFIQVIGNTTISTLILPKESEILIPLIFQYRMVDRLGNINGIKGFRGTDLTYSKKIGIDILINNSLFKFDINCIAKLKAKITSIDSKNISKIAGNYRNETRETLY